MVKIDVELKFKGNIYIVSITGLECRVITASMKGDKRRRIEVYSIEGKEAAICSKGAMYRVPVKCIIREWDIDERD